MPILALARRRPDDRIKPIIRTHLSELGVALDERLVGVLKQLADQYYDSVLREPYARQRKMGIEGVRALRRGTYRALLERQANRCAVCGVPFAGGADETLDHILPWCLAGDPYDGSNWQILCPPCNRGKREWLSAWQSPQSLNWFYGTTDTLPTEVPSAEVRYLALALAGRCQSKGCTSGPTTSELVLVRRVDSGLAILDNLIVLCRKDAAQNREALEVEARPHVPAPVEASEPRVVTETIVAERDHESPDSKPIGQFGQYSLVKTVQNAGMAQAFVAISEDTGEKVFVKRTVEESPQGRALQREAEIYQKLYRKNALHVPQVIEVVREGNEIALILECAEGDLEEYVHQRGGHLPTNDAKAIALELAEALQELHGANIVHRDLKPRNVLRCGERWVLADFGISKDTLTVSPGATFRLRGTSGYAAPEQVLTGVEALPSADVYAFGKVLVFLLTGTTDIDNVQFRSWRRLIRQCTEDQEDARPAIAEILRGLQAIDE
ncbi:MAG TPA: protein kinase [Polyangia bacterium]|nr:protein kinase [Polyangia bacterium]